MTKNNQSTKEEEATAVTVVASSGWCVVQSEPNRERQAKFFLSGNGFDVYLPMRLCAAKSKATATPLFPRYMFVQLDTQVGDWFRMFSTPNVSAVITHTTRRGVRPSWVPKPFIEGLRAREVNGVLDLGLGATRGGPLPLKAGDKVRVVCGDQMGELDAVFLERVDTNRVMILLSIIGRESRVTVQASSLKGS